MCAYMHDCTYIYKYQPSFNLHLPNVLFNVLASLYAIVRNVRSTQPRINLSLHRIIFRLKLLTLLYINLYSAQTYIKNYNSFICFGCVTRFDNGTWLIREDPARLLRLIFSFIFSNSVTDIGMRIGKYIAFVFL